MMRVMSAKRVLLALLIVATTGAVSCGGESGPPGTASRQPAPDDATTGSRAKSPRTPSDEQPTSLPPEDPAPDFSVETFDGQTFSLAEQRGTPVVLNFWESW